MATKVKQLADEEAERVEAEEEQPAAPEPAAPDDDGEDEAADAETPAPAPPTEASAEKQSNDFAKEMLRHRKAVEKIMGLDEPLEDAPLDWVIGFALPGALAPRTHETYKACPTCNGLGDVLTGSHKEGNQTQPCPRCAGRGYLDKLTQPVAAPERPNYATAANVPSTATLHAGAAPQNGETVQAEPGMEGYGVPSWAGDLSIRPGA